MEEVKVNGWNMLDSYKEGQAIYGRESEITSINESIQYNVQTFLYGKSGIGKTSLIQAGIFPKLRKEHFFPIVIRLAFYDTSSDSLTNVIKRLVCEEAEKRDSEIGKVSLHHNVIDDTDVSTASLYDFFSKVSFEDADNEPYIPVLVFDQFEETINNEENWQRTVDFLKDELYDLMDNSNAIHGETLPYTNYRIVFSMREDYLYCLEDIIDQYSLWELRYNRFRVKALDDNKASEVIHKTSGISGLEEGKEDLIVNTIIKIVKLNSGTRFSEINTALLSLICSLLYDNSEDNCICYRNLRNINSYLRLYYDDVCNKVGSKATHYLESHLLTKDGRRSSMDESEALSSGKISQESLDYLVEKRLLRRIKTDSKSNRYEYIHDLFAMMVYKRLQDDKSQWYYPELRTLSGKEDSVSFFRKFIMSSVIITVGFCLVLIYHSKFTAKHDTWNFLICFDPSQCVNTAVYLYIFLISVYLLSLVSKRLHDVGKSGWWCSIIPISVFLINCQHYLSMFVEYRYLFLTGKIVGFSMIGYLVYNCFRSSVNDSRELGYSKDYEAIFNLCSVNNIEFVKALCIELFWWIMCCCLTDVIYYSNSRIEIWHLFYWRTPIVPLDSLFGFKTTFPAVLSMLHIFICASPALKARVNSLGYPTWISFVPFFNVLLLVEGLFPDKLLIKIKLINTNKGRNQKESDNIFSEISDDFTYASDEDVIYKDQVRKNLKGRTIFMLIFVPFYGIIKGCNKHVINGIRVTSMQMAILNWLFMTWLLILFIAQGYLDFVNDIGGFCILGLFCVWYFIPIIGLIILSRGQKRMIINFIKEHPTYSINQIAHEFAFQPSSLEKIINKMKKKGEIIRIEENGQLLWKVVKD